MREWYLGPCLTLYFDTCVPIFGSFVELLLHLSQRCDHVNQIAPKSIRAFAVIPIFGSFVEFQHYVHLRLVSQIELVFESEMESL